MDSKHGKMRLNVESDRLSNLPDDLIHKILAFINIKDAIETSVLSSRWRFIWTTMPYLNLSIRDFASLPKFSKFVTNVLYRRDYLTNVYSLNLRIRIKASQVFAKRILNYVLSHNIQQLNVVFLHEKNIEFPLCLFSSKSLKHLSLTMQDGVSCRYRVNSCFTSTWQLPNLTTLDLHFVTLRDNNADKYINVISNCKNLNNLTLTHLTVIGSKGFSIFHPRLSNLTLEYKYCVNVVNVVTPQLKNLTIRFSSGKHVISAPNLASLLYKGYHPLHLSTEGFPLLENANICFSSQKDENSHQIVYLLQQLHNVKYLTLNLEIVEFLSSSVELLLHQPSPFVNIKRLNIYPERVYGCKQELKIITIMSTELKSYFLDSSSDVTITMVLREEIQALNLMAELRVRLKKVKNNSKTNSKENSCEIISKLQDIEKLLTKLPESCRAKIQPSFSTLCSEAHVIICQITDCVKIECNEN